MKIKYTYIVNTSDGFRKIYECHDDGGGISSVYVKRLFFLENHVGKLKQISEKDFQEAVDISREMVKEI